MYVSYSERFVIRAISLYCTDQKNTTSSHVTKCNVDGILKNVIQGKLYQLCHLNNEYQN
jgi:hypothetical protein